MRVNFSYSLICFRKEQKIIKEFDSSGVSSSRCQRTRAVIALVVIYAREKKVGTAHAGQIQSGMALSDGSVHQKYSTKVKCSEPLEKSYLVF